MKGLLGMQNEGRTKMRKLLALTISCLVVASLVSCVSPSAVLAAADAAVKVEAVAEQAAGNADAAGYLQHASVTIEALAKLYESFESASASAKPGVASQIEAAVVDLAAQDKQILSLVGVKNPNRLVITEGIIASVESAIVLVQNQAPAPSGNSVQLNSTVMQMKAAVR